MSLRHPSLRLPAALLPHLLKTQAHYLAHLENLFLCVSAAQVVCGDRVPTQEERDIYEPLQTFFIKALHTGKVACLSLSGWAHRNTEDAALRATLLGQNSETLQRQLRIDWMQWLIENAEPTP